MTVEEPQLGTRPRLVALSESECRERLGGSSLGRVGLLGAQPAVLPVTYALLDDAVVFRTSNGSKLGAASREALVVFEVDGADLQARTGWSVMVLGHAEIVTDSSTLERVEALGLPTVLPGLDTVVRIRPTRVTGRALTPAARG